VNLPLFSTLEFWERASTFLTSDDAKSAAPFFKQVVEDPSVVIGLMNESDLPF
jgi:hypothetical protein